MVQKLKHALPQKIAFFFVNPCNLWRFRLLWEIKTKYQHFNFTCCLFIEYMHDLLMHIVLLIIEKQGFYNRRTRT